MNDKPTRLNCSLPDLGYALIILATFAFSMLTGFLIGRFL